MAQFIPAPLSAARKAKIDGAEQVANKNQPGGYLGIDSDGRAQTNGISVRYGTKAEIEVIVLAAGEIAVVTDAVPPEIRFGDGETPGGTRVSDTIASENTIYLNAGETAADNFARLKAAYADAKAIDPFDATRTSLNPMWLVLGPGSYLIDETWAIDGDYVNPVALIPGSVNFVTSGSNLTAMAITAEQLVMSGINVTGVIANANPLVTIGVGSSDVSRFENIRIITNGLNGISPAAAGDYDNIEFRRVIAPSFFGFRAGIMSGVDGANAGTGVLFDDCEGGSKSFFGGNTAAGAGTFSGTLRRSRMYGTTWNLKLAGVLLDVLSKAPVTRLVSGARVIRSIFDTASDALQNDAAVSIKADGNLAGGDLLGTDVSNSWASSTNLENAGTDLW